jgi:CHAT domain-containing protein
VPGFTRLHLAVHGQTVNSDTPMESHLTLPGARVEGLEIAGWRLSAELVVLSACCSGQRPIGGRGLDELPGDDLFGLQAAFFAAGAKRIVCSLWPAESTVAEPLMTNFHRRLLDGEEPEFALQHAMIDNLASADREPLQRYFWAPFFLSALGRPVQSERSNQDD